MRFVWDESINQAREMLQSWTRNAESGISSVAKDTRTLSLNVLAATGFRRSYNFRSSSQAGSDEAGTYRDALQTVLDHAILLMLVPPRFLLLPLLPKSWARLGKAATDFKQYMMHMLDEETSLLDQGKTGTGSLMTSFVRALDVHRKEERALKTDADSLPPKGLTVDEIFGNIFVINFAGHDTTANTLAFSMLLLGANPEVQDWVAEELQEVTADWNSKKWDYSVMFSDLKRCRAVLVCTIYLNTNSSTLTCIARDSSPLSTDSSTSQMEQSASPKAPDRRKDNCHSTTNRSHAKPTYSPDTS
jgi:cytochrome P450